MSLFETLNWLDALLLRREVEPLVDHDLRAALRFARGRVHHANRITGACSLVNRRAPRSATYADCSPRDDLRTAPRRLLAERRRVKVEDL
jgi:hypothetical protein